MRIAARVCSLALFVLLANGAMAQNSSFVGTWKLDISHSAFGSDPAPRSFTFTMTKDSPELGSYRGHGVGHDGKPLSVSWSGPEDGTMHPMKNAAGKTLVMQSLKKQPDGTMLRHGEDSSDGSSFDGVSTVADDGNTLTEEITGKSKDGTQTKIRHVYHRAATADSGQKAKSQ